MNCALKWCFSILLIAERESWMICSDGDHSMPAGGHQLDKWVSPPITILSISFVADDEDLVPSEEPPPASQKGSGLPKFPCQTCQSHISQKLWPKYGATFNEEQVTLRHSAVDHSNAADYLHFRICEEQVGIYLHSWLLYDGVPCR